jgi:hypothetical protein
VKVKVHAANIHDSVPLVEMLDEFLTANPGIKIGNLNADNGYQSDANADFLESKCINDSISPRKKSTKKISKELQNLRKCVEAIFGIGVQCFDLEHTWVRGLENVTKDVLLKFIAMLFMAVVAFETGEEDAYMKPTYFFG